MLLEHLSPSSDLASRRAFTIDAHVGWIHDVCLHGRPGRVLDLACGPGLYLHRLARLGHTGLGIDFGPASIEYAEHMATRNGLPVSFLEADIRHAIFGDGFDLVTFIYGQLNVFAPAEAAELLARARASLEPGGRLLVEVQTEAAVRGAEEEQRTWSTADSGLFSATPHITLYERFWSAADLCTTERWFVIDANNGASTRYAQTTHAYSPDALTMMFREAGFDGVEILPCLPGGTDDGLLCAIVANNPDSAHGERRT